MVDAAQVVRFDAAGIAPPLAAPGATARNSEARDGVLGARWRQAHLVLQNEFVSSLHAPGARTKASDRRRSSRGGPTRSRDFARCSSACGTDARDAASVTAREQSEREALPEPSGTASRSLLLAASRSWPMADEPRRISSLFRDADVLPHRGYVWSHG